MTNRLATQPPLRIPMGAGVTIEVPIPLASVAWIRSVARRDRANHPGWDVIEDEWSDEQILDAIKDADGIYGAHEVMSRIVLKIRSERKAEAIT